MDQLKAKTLSLGTRAAPGPFGPPRTFTTAMESPPLIQTLGYDTGGRPTFSWFDYGQGLLALIDDAVAPMPGGDIMKMARNLVFGSGGDLAGAFAYFSTDSSKRVFASLRAAGGGFGDPIAVSPPNTLPKFLDMSVAPDGEMVIVWNQKEGGKHRLYGAVRAPGAPGFALLGAISPAGAEDAWPTVAHRSDGGTVIAWVRDGRIAIATRPRGGSFGDPQIVGTEDGNTPRLARGAGGTVVLSWRGTGQKLWVLVDPPNGSPEVAVEPAAAPDLLDMAVGVTPDGSVVAAWQEDQGRLYGAVRRPGGTFGPGVKLSTGAYGGSRPAIAGDLIVWDESRLNADQRLEGRIAWASVEPPSEAVAGPDGKPVDPRDRTAPKVTVKVLDRRARKGRVRVRVTVDEASYIEVTGRIARKRLGAVRAVAIRSKTVTVKLPRGVARGRLELTVKAADGGGNARRVKKSARLR
jgi:hypothetical protein